MNHFRLTFIAVTSIIGIAVSASGYALQDSKHPIIDKSDNVHQAPLDLNNVPLEQLLKYQQHYQQKMEKLNRKMADQKTPELITAMHTYDVSRLKIVEVIPQLIKTYSLDKEMKQQLLTYAETFGKIREDYRQMEQGKWSDYRAYDFRLGIAYQSMLYLFAQNNDLYQRIQTDMENIHTPIGTYVKELNTAYAQVEVVNAANPEYYLIRQIERELKRIRNEINQR